MFKKIALMIVPLLLLSCTSPQTTPPPATPTHTFVPPTIPPSVIPSPTLPTPTKTFTPVPPTATSTATPIPTVESLKALVTEDLNCRYGPGAEYLHLYGLRKGANIVLIGRTDGENWNWVYVAGKNKCWVNAKHIEIHGEMKSLPIVYPGVARLPVSPYYPPTTVLNTARDPITNVVEISWLEIPLRAGDEEDETMLHYLIEVWRCENGAMLFEPLATNEISITFIDQPGCAQSSHGRVFVQEKHGFAGPAEIPWPAP
jgi:uncharacterized protein YraI